MSFRKQTGNMYDFVTHTWNVIKGRCEHDCVYCYMKRWGELKPVRFDDKEMTRDLGEGNVIFVGSSNDMFSAEIPDDWIKQVLNHCIMYPVNQYLFQSKNPGRMPSYSFPENTIFGTTIETNRDYNVSLAPSVTERANAIGKIRHYKTMVTIEPILDFDLKELVDLVKLAQPNWINIGADSKKNNLPEPSFKKVRELINELSKITKVRQKHNLKRLES